MNDTKALCPKCQNVVQFEREGNYNRCPACGSMYLLTQWRHAADEPRREEPSFAKFFGLLIKTVLIMVAILVVGVAVLFAGCLVAAGGHL